MGPEGIVRREIRRRARISALIKSFRTPLTITAGSAVFAFLGDELLLWARHFGLNSYVGSLEPRLIGFWILNPGETLTLYNITKITFAIGLLVMTRRKMGSWMKAAAVSSAFLGFGKAWDDFHDTADMVTGATAGLFALAYLIQNRSQR